MVAFLLDVGVDHPLDMQGDTQEPPIPPPPSVKDSGGQHKSSRIDSQTVLILGVSVGILVTALLAMVAGAIIVAFRIKKRQQRVQGRWPAYCASTSPRGGQHGLVMTMPLWCPPLRNPPHPK